MTGQSGGHGSQKVLREDAALAALLSEPTIDAAANRCGVSRATLYRWLDDPAFLARYRAARRQVVEHAVSRLQQTASAAVDALETLVGDTAQPGAVRVSAAKAILDYAFKGVEMLDLVAEI